MALEQAFVPGAFKIIQIACLAPEAPLTFKYLCAFAANETLDLTPRIGRKFLLSKEPADGHAVWPSVFCAFAMKLMQVWYLKNQETIASLSVSPSAVIPLSSLLNRSMAIIQYLITPLLAHYVQRCSCSRYWLVGRNSGPKMGNNLLDLMHAQVPSSKVIMI